MSLPLLSPREANARIADGAKLIDIRDAVGKHATHASALKH